MKRFAIAALIVLAGQHCTPAGAQTSADFSSIDAKLQTCIDQHPDIPGNASCVKTAADAADKLLNEIYAKILQHFQHSDPDEAKADPEIRKRLIAAERAWIAFRDAECGYESTVALGAPLEGFENVDCLYAQTKARAKTLTAPEAPQNAR